MRLAASLRYALYAAIAVLLVSGASRAPGTALLRVHGAASMVFLVLAGAAIALHVPPAWRQRKNRLSGALLAAFAALLALSGYLLYYSGDEALRNAASWAHWLIGLALPALMLGHYWMARRVSGRA